jgi:carbon monoxide dehydrogenase subunit G
MELEHTFTVAVPVEAAWDVLQDLERIVPCMPGASLTSYSGDEFTGTVKVKLGPVTMTFAGQGRFVERDTGSRRIVVEAAGKDRRGGGTARAAIRAALRDQGDVTAVDVHSDLVVTGRAAQFGRGMIAEVSNRLLGQFTDCLASELAAGAGAGAATPSAPGAAATGRSGTAAAADGGPEGGPDAAGAPAAGGGLPGTGQAEPIDLLGVTGVRTAVARLVPYLVVFVVGVLVGAGLVAWLG